MIKKYKLKNIREYMVTIVVTTLVVFGLCLFIELDLLFRSEEKINTLELNTENLAKFCTIEQLEKRLSQEPTNYAVNIKLGILYESLKKYQKANEYYQNALRLSGRSNYSLYAYAKFCAKRKLYGIATILSEELKGNNKKTYVYKAKIYEAIADSLMDDGNFSAASKAYQVSYKYAKNIPNKSDYKAIRDKYAESYAKAADNHMENSMIEEAISDLENSLRIKNNALASYKLGLIYSKIDKVKAEIHINNAFKKNPFIINPYIYNSLLTDLIEEAKLSGDANALNIYSMKQNKLKRDLEKFYVYKNDVIIEKSQIITDKKWFSNKQKYFLTFDLKNNTKTKLNQLFLQVELFVNSKRYVIEKKVISGAAPLDFYEVLSDTTLDLPDDISFMDVKNKNDIIVKYYAKKTRKAPWTLLNIEFINF